MLIPTSSLNSIYSQLLHKNTNLSKQGNGPSKEQPVKIQNVARQISPSASSPFFSALWYKKSQIILAVKAISLTAVPVVAYIAHKYFTNGNIEENKGSSESSSHPTTSTSSAFSDHSRNPQTDTGSDTIVKETIQTFSEPTSSFFQKCDAPTVSFINLFASFNNQSSSKEEIKIVTELASSLVPNPDESFVSLITPFASLDPNAKEKITNLTESFCSLGNYTRKETQRSAENAPFSSMSTDVFQIAAQPEESIDVSKEPIPPSLAQNSDQIEIPVPVQNLDIKQQIDVSQKTKDEETPITGSTSSFSSSNQKEATPTKEESRPMFGPQPRASQNEKTKNEANPSKEESRPVFGPQPRTPQNEKKKKSKTDQDTSESTKNEKTSNKSKKNSNSKKSNKKQK